MFNLLNIYRIIPNRYSVVYCLNGPNKRKTTAKKEIQQDAHTPTVSEIELQVSNFMASNLRFKSVFPVVYDLWSHELNNSYLTCRTSSIWSVQLASYPEAPNLQGSIVVLTTKLIRYI